MDSENFKIFIVLGYKYKKSMRLKTLEEKPRKIVLLLMRVYGKQKELIRILFKLLRGRAIFDIVMLFSREFDR